MKTFLKSFTLFLWVLSNTVSAQDYDVGVFYMPHWQNNHVPDPTGSAKPRIPIPYHLGMGGTQSHNLQTTPCQPSWVEPVDIQKKIRESHWHIINEYDGYMVAKTHTGFWDNYRKLQQPPNIWYADNPDVQGFGFFDSPGVWYNETVQQVVEKQVDMMSDHGIDFVIYDWYWSYVGIDHCTGQEKWAPYWEGTVRNWLNPAFDDSDMEMAIYWAGNYANLVEPDSKGVGGNPNLANGVFDAGKGLDQLIDRVGEFMMAQDANGNYRYKLKEGDNGMDENVFYLDWGGLTSMLSINSVRNHPFFSGYSGTSNSALVSRISLLLNHINYRLFVNTGRSTYFVALVSEIGPTDAQTYSSTWRYNWMVNWPRTAGFDAISTYTYKLYDENDYYDWDSDDPGPIWQWNMKDDYDYSTMTSVYSRFYNYYKNNLPTGIEYQVPVTEGWNRAPFNMRQAGGEFEQYPKDPAIYTSLSHLKDQSHAGLKANEWKATIWDNAHSTPTTYHTALQNAKNFIDQNPVKTDETVLLCCWNEHAEGTTIEPSFAWGFQYLEKVKLVFDGPGLLDIPDDPNDPFNPLGPTANMENRLSNDQTDINSFEIAKVYPNPFKSETKISYRIPGEGRVKVEIFNAMNQSIAVLTDATLKKGEYSATWHNAQKATGIYFCRVTYGMETKTVKLIAQD